MEQQTSFCWATSQSARFALVIEYVSSIHPWANSTVPLWNKWTKTYANAHTRMPMRVYEYGHTRIGICVWPYVYTKYTHMLISIYDLAYCCFLCNTVVKCCFNGLVILGLYGLTKSLRAKYGRTSHSFTKFFKQNAFCSVTVILLQ